MYNRRFQRKFCESRIKAGKNLRLPGVNYSNYCTCPLLHVLDQHDNDCMENNVIFFLWDNSQIVNTRATFPPTYQIRRHKVKKLYMEAAGCFWCVNMSTSALSNVSVCERFKTPVDCLSRQAESAEKCVCRKVAQESCSSVQDCIEL